MRQGGGPETAFAVGDRVRVVAGDGPYTGCRGTVAEPPYPLPSTSDGAPVGCYVAVDGENGRVRPFLCRELERVRIARVRPPEPEGGRVPNRRSDGR